MATQFSGYAATAKGDRLKPFQFDPGALRDEEVEIEVTHCGICHSDLSMIDNEWAITKYPLVPGHEAVGTITALGGNAKGLKVGQRVGLGWTSETCMACHECLSGNQNLCPDSQGTIVERHGAFADHVRCHWSWAIPIPEALASDKAGPLFCGGVTVFHPILLFGVKPTDRVGVIGIGGLGHLALQFLNKWGCEVFAFSSSDSKREEAMKMGAHHVVNSKDSAQLKKIEGGLNFIISTVNVALDWNAYLQTLAPGGRLHVVGAVLKPLGVPAMALIGGQKSISGSPVGTPTSIALMLEFCARHGIAPITENFPLSQVNDAVEHLRAGKARYRLVLTM